MTPEITTKIAEIQTRLNCGFSGTINELRLILTALVNSQREIEELRNTEAKYHQFVTDTADCDDRMGLRLEELKQQLADAATREAGKNKMIASLQGELADWYALGADTPDGLQVQLQEMLETIAVLSDTTLVRKLVESDGILGDMLVAKEKRIVELEAELEKERSLATTFMKQRDAMQGERDQQVAEKQAWIDSYYEQIHMSLLCRAERDQLAAEVRRHIIQFRSIEASLGTLDQSEAIDDERALPDWASTKVAQLVDQFAKSNKVLESIMVCRHHDGDTIRSLIQQLAEQSERLRKLREALTIYADDENWNCPRCGKRDRLNCFMGRWTGPVDHDENAEIQVGIGHGYDTARKALLDSPGPAQPASEVNEC